MKRRTLLAGTVAALVNKGARAGAGDGMFEEAAQVLEKACATGQVAAAALYVARREAKFVGSFGAAHSDQAMFLLGSITKPLCVTALMTLYDAGRFRLDDPLRKFIPQATGEGRDEVTMRHLLCHTSGLPDQLPENARLRKNHAPLAEFVDHALRIAPAFKPGTRYQYSSMGILLASRVAEILSGEEIRTFVERVVFKPLEMKHSVLGLGRLTLEQVVTCQIEHAAPEAGGGDPAASDWDWNSAYWRRLGAPWGGAHASAPDLGRFLAEFLARGPAMLAPTTLELMVTNQNSAGLTPRGLGFNVGAAAGSPGCSEKTFGHTGSTGTLFWADPGSQTVCVVLTSLPAAAVKPHPRDAAAARAAQQVK
jgi:CubicO group peptidase (beta-lactamase class C family)